jgi:hypothetical protein
MLIPVFNQRTMTPTAPPPPRPEPRPAPRPKVMPDAAAMLQRSVLPWGHPNAVELRRLFRKAAEQ